MDDFKLRSIDDFDSDFISAKSAPAQPQAAEKSKSSLLPEFDSEAAPESGEQYKTVQTAPTISGDPLYTPERMSGAPVDNLFSNEDDEYYEEDEKENKPKAGVGAVIGKIAAILVLAATVVIFLLGCFISVFLDNNGSTVFGRTFNTLARETTVNDVTLHKGDLIIAIKNDDADYSVGEHIVVPTSTSDPDAKGCDVLTINQVTYQDSVEAYVTSSPGNSFGVTAVYTKDSCYGANPMYINHLGGIISFAMDNAFWFCLAFILVAALCICSLVLINWTVASKAESRKKEDEE